MKCTFTYITSLLALSFLCSLRAGGPYLPVSNPVPMKETNDHLRSGEQRSSSSFVSSLAKSVLLIGGILSGIALFSAWTPPQWMQRAPAMRAQQKTHKDPYTFRNIAGAIPQDVKEITDFIKNNEKYAAMGARMPKGILLVGPTGTGKTSLARAIAGETDAYFIFASGASFTEIMIGVGPARIRSLFKEARDAIQSGTYKKAIIFIDEIDTIGVRRGADMGSGGVNEQNATLNELLNQMDGFFIDNSIFVMAATNRFEELDPALKRPGRFDRIAYIGLPDQESREAIIQYYSQKIKTDGKIDYTDIAKHTEGMSGADIGNFVNEAAVRAVRENVLHTMQRHFLQALESRSIA